MIYRLNDILRDVRVALDENAASGQLVGIGDTDTLSLDEIIRSKIEESARRVEQTAPVNMLHTTHSFSKRPFWGALDSGWVMLPDDFMRLVAFRMSDWERTVHHAISVTDPEYEKQSSRFKGIRGNTQKPVCALVTRPEGKSLEFYSCNSHDAQVTQALYLPYPQLDSNGGIDLSPECYRAIIYTAASLTLFAYGSMEKAQAFSSLAESLINPEK